MLLYIRVTRTHEIIKWQNKRRTSFVSHCKSNCDTGSFVSECTGQFWRHLACDHCDALRYLIAAMIHGNTKCNGNSTWISVLCLHCESDCRAGMFVRVCDSHHRVQCSPAHCTSVQQWTAGVQERTGEHDGNPQRKTQNRLTPFTIRLWIASMNKLIDTEH